MDVGMLGVGLLEIGALGGASVLDLKCSTMLARSFDGTALMKCRFGGAFGEIGVFREIPGGSLIGDGSFVWEVRQRVLSAYRSDGLKGFDVSSCESFGLHLMMREISGRFDDVDGFIA